MTDLICVPLKKASDVDIVKPLKNIIATLYSTADNPEDFSADIQELSYMRTQAVSKSLDKSAAALELLYKWVLFILKHVWYNNIQISAQIIMSKYVLKVLRSNIQHRK